MISNLVKSTNSPNKFFHSWTFYHKDIVSNTFDLNRNNIAGRWYRLIKINHEQIRDYTLTWNELCTNVSSKSRAKHFFPYISGDVTEKSGSTNGWGLDAKTSFNLVYFAFCRMWLLDETATSKLPSLLGLRTPKQQRYRLKRYEKIEGEELMPLCSDMINNLGIGRRRYLTSEISWFPFSSDCVITLWRATILPPCASEWNEVDNKVYLLDASSTSWTHSSECLLLLDWTKCDD